MADQAAFLNAISKAIRKNNPGKDEEDLPNIPTLPPANPNELTVAPGKPDPEAVANSQISNAATKGGVAQPLGGYKGAMPPTSNGINPDTGMPYFSPQPQMSDDDKAKLQLKMRYLQNLQNSGGNSDQ